MQQINLSINVKTNASVSPEEVAKIVQRLIDVGLSDAAATIESGEGAVKEAELATDLTIHAPEVARVPRVLVVVNGGMADTVQDSLLDVVVFDWDNYKEDPEGTGGVPAEFADLAKPCGIPVQGADEEEDDDDSGSYSDGGLYSALGISSSNKEG